jgi:rubrerythrin
MKIPDIQSSEEFLALAALIERSGAEMYKKLAGKAGAGEMATLFTQLAAEEEEHEKVFLSLGKISHEPGFTEGILKKSEGSDLFSSERLSGELAYVDDPEDILNFAIRRELDTILFYKRMLHKGFDAKQIIEDVIKMEEEHFYRLHQLKESL